MSAFKHVQLDGSSFIRRVAESEHKELMPGLG